MKYNLLFFLFLSLNAFSQSKSVIIQQQQARIDSLTEALEIQKEELPNDIKLIGTMVEAICYKNAKNYFPIVNIALTLPSLVASTNPVFVKFLFCLVPFFVKI